MNPLSVIALFCEDVRAEASGMTSLVGIYTDNVNVPRFPFVFPKIAIYVRVLFDITMDLPPVSIWIRSPGVSDASLLSTFDENLIAKSKAEAGSHGAPVTGLITSAISSPFPIFTPGRVLVFARWGDEDRICGGLNVQPTPPG